MFLGHFGIGFGAKSSAPSVSLGTLLLAAQFIDLLWPVFLMLGWEKVAIDPGNTAVTPLDFNHYPISHSLLSVIGWGLLLGGIYWLAKKNRTGAIIVGLLVVSHWLLDLVVHRPDLPLFPGDSPMLGLELWNSTAGTVIVEGLVFAAGVTLYLRTTRAKDRAGKYSIWVLVMLLILIYAGNLLGPLPPSVNAIAWAGHLQWLLVAIGYWVDAHRTSDPGTMPLD